MFMFIEPIYRSVLIARILTVLTLLKLKTSSRDWFFPLSFCDLANHHINSTQYTYNVIFDKDKVKFNSDLFSRNVLKVLSPSAAVTLSETDLVTSQCQEINRLN